MEILVYFASVVFFVDISGIQVGGWLTEVSELSACDIVQLACDHTKLASSGQFGSWVGEILLSFRPTSTMLVVLSYSLECHFTV